MVTMIGDRANLENTALLNCANGDSIWLVVAESTLEGIRVDP